MAVFLVVAGALVLVTRPDLVLLKTLGTSTTAGACNIFEHHREWFECKNALTAAGVDVEALRLVEVLAFGLADFSFLAAGAFFVVVLFALVAVVFLGAAAFLVAFGLASTLF